MPNIEEIKKRGEEIYRTLVDEKKIDVEKDKGKFLIINIENGDYELCENIEGGLERLSSKYPNKLFYTMKIGFPGVYSTSGYLELNKV